MEVMTKLVQCPNGHYYNAANHSACPICGAGSEAGTSGAGSFGPTVAPGSAASTPAGGAGNFGPTVAPGSASAAAGSGAGSFGPTMAPGGASAAGSGFSATQPVSSDHRNGSNTAPFAPTVSVIAAEGGAAANAVEPVVGWLVCVEGPMRGNDYRIREGYNYIGREIGDIHIRGDQTISRQRHAKIAYDSNGHQYFFGPDEGRNLLRVNGKTIMAPVELHNYDILTIGQTKLMFIGLCGEQFSWSQE